MNTQLDQRPDIPEVVNRISSELKQEAILIVFWGTVLSLCIAPLMFRNLADSIDGISFLLILPAYGIFEYIVALEFAGLKRWTYPIVRFVLMYVRGFNQNKWVDYRKAINGPIVRQAFGIQPYRLE